MYIGNYWLQSSPGYAVKVFCDMERVCGCDEGRGEGEGWMRVNISYQYHICKLSDLLPATLPDIESIYVAIYTFCRINMASSELITYKHGQVSKQT